MTALDTTEPWGTLVWVTSDGSWGVFEDRCLKVVRLNDNEYEALSDGMYTDSDIAALSQRPNAATLVPLTPTIWTKRP